MELLWVAPRPAVSPCACPPSQRAGMKKEHVSENSIMIYDDVMYPDNVTYEHIGEISIS